MTITVNAIYTNGQLTLKEPVALREGTLVTVTIRPLVGGPGTDGKAYPLRGMPLHYDRPTEPVADAEWETLA